MSELHDDEPAELRELDVKSALSAEVDMRLWFLEGAVNHVLAEITNNPNASEANKRNMLRSITRLAYVAGYGESVHDAEEGDHSMDELITAWVEVEDSSE